MSSGLFIFMCCILFLTCIFFIYIYIYIYWQFYLHIPIVVIDLIFFTENSFMRICIYSFDCTMSRGRVLRRYFRTSRIYIKI